MKAGSAYLATNIKVTLNPYAWPAGGPGGVHDQFPCDVMLQVQGDIPINKDFKDNSTSHSIPIVGLYPGEVNSVS